jgi:hypothetical protein
MTTTTVQAQLPQRAEVSGNTEGVACRTPLMDAETALTSERFDLSDDELEQHIDDLAWSWRVAYDRFQRYSLPADRDEALMLLHLHNRAVMSRSPAVQAARHAQFERDLEERCNYFGTRAAQDVQAMETRGQ